MIFDFPPIVFMIKVVTADIIEDVKNISG